MSIAIPSSLVLFRRLFCPFGKGRRPADVCVYLSQRAAHFYGQLLATW